MQLIDIKSINDTFYIFVYRLPIAIKLLRYIDCNSSIAIFQRKSIKSIYQLQFFDCCQSIAIASYKILRFLLATHYHSSSLYRLWRSCRIPVRSISSNDGVYARNKTRLGCQCSKTSSWWTRNGKVLIHSCLMYLSCILGSYFEHQFNRMIRSDMLDVSMLIENARNIENFNFDIGFK